MNVKHECKINKHDYEIIKQINYFSLETIINLEAKRMSSEEEPIILILI